MIRYRSSSTAILLAAALLASCSSGSREVTPTVPAYTPDEDQSTSAAAEPSESATATDGPLTAEGLSDPAAEYTVSAIPEDLDETQTAVLRGYMAYDRATWDAYRAMDGDLSRVQAASTGDAWSTYRTEYQSAQDAGASMTGRYDLDIKPRHPGRYFRDRFRLRGPVGYRHGEPQRSGCHTGNHAPPVGAGLHARTRRR